MSLQLERGILAPLDGKHSVGDDFVTAQLHGREPEPIRLARPDDRMSVEQTPVCEATPTFGK